MNVRIKQGFPLFALLFILVLSACGRDKLTKEYEVFEGYYDWVSTGANKTAWIHGSIDPDRTGYDAQLELDDDGHVRFFKNSALISEHTYRIVDRETNAYGAMIMIELKGSTDHLDITDERLTIRLLGDTGLTVDRFPFPAIDKADHYLQGYQSTSNQFHR